MARDGLLTFVCAVATLLIGSLSGLAAPPDDSALVDILAVQSAMQQAREHLLHNRPREAVSILHRELGHINGNPVYLALLRDTYQAAIKELQLAHQEAEAQRRMLDAVPHHDYAGRSADTIVPLCLPLDGVS